MVGILREADKDTVSQAAKRHGVSEQTIYGWRQRFSGINADGVKRLRQLEQGNNRLKRPLAEGDLGIEVMKEVAAKKMVGAPARRRQVVFALRRGLSQRKACALFSVSRSALGSASRLKARDGPLLTARKQLSDQFPRFGYRRILVFMEQLGHARGPDKALRLWQKAGLQVPRKRPRKRVAHSRSRPLLPSGANEVWAYDFVHDGCANGQQLKCLTIIDEYTRECLAIDVAGSNRSNRVIEILSRLVSKRWPPRHLRSDNGPEFVSKALLRWVANQGLEVALIDPGKPWQNGMVESFNGKFRDECLSMEWFRSRTEAKVVIEDWRRTYNEVLPHSSLGKMTPMAFARMVGNNSNPGATLKN